MPWLLHDPVAGELVGGAVAVLAFGEVGATFAGRARSGEGWLLGSAAESLLLVTRRDGPAAEDRGTIWIVVASSRLGLGAAIVIGALVPALRAGANTWWTLGIGVAVTIVGVALRAWAIVTLGRWFRRKVTIEPGQRLVRAGPYRVLRHPSYAGLLLAFFGLGLAFGSWVGAAIAFLLLWAGLMPRIRVEEGALARTFGAEYDDYARATARLVPGLW
jgi:protein-S-isoprenylcysteine O-methyltransferase Ste14